MTTPIAVAVSTMTSLYADAEQLRRIPNIGDADQAATGVAHQWRDRLFAAAAEHLADPVVRSTTMSAITELRNVAEAERRSYLTADALRNPHLTVIAKTYRAQHRERYDAAVARLQSLTADVVDAFGEGFEL